MGETSTVAVTLLFTDLVGSTALGSSRSADDADGLRRTHFALLREAVEATGGREVKNLGDGLMVVFTSPSRALACGVAMQQAIDRHNRRGGDLSVRIGIACGETTEEDGDYFGDPVIEAARLTAAAEGGQILATEIVQAMVGRHSPVELRSVGDLELKGMPAPVPTVEARWHAAAAEATPLPPRLRTASNALSPFLGRAEEVAALEEAWKQAAGGELRVVLVGGEPGVGKTSLAAQAARSAHATGGTALFGACDEGFASPYQPWVMALTHLVRHRHGVADTLPGAHRHALHRLLPAAFEDPAPGDDTDQQLLLDAVASLLESAASDDPVLLVLDDLQWADAASLDLLRHVARSCPDAPLLVIGTYRSSELARGALLPSLLADLWRVPGTARLDLEGLADDDLMDMLAAAAGHEMTADGVALAHALRRETGGNPFFTVELLRHLLEVGAFALDDDGRYSLTADIAELAMPASVREVVGHRVARLGDDVVAVLSTAAVIGQEFEFDLLMTVTETEADGLIVALERAVDAALVIEAVDRPGQYRFVHALIGHTLAQDLGPSRRRRLHERIAVALEALDDAAHVGELARHWLAAARPADADRAIHYATLAGDQAIDAAAPHDAIGWFEQALDLLERQPGADETQRGRLLTKLAYAQLSAGDPEWRATRSAASAIAARVAVPDLLVAVARCTIGVLGITELPDPERLHLIEMALDTAAAEDPATRAELLVYLADEHDARDSEVRNALAKEALGIARHLDANAQTVDVFANALFTLNDPALLEERHDAAQLAVDMARRCGQRLSAALAQLATTAVQKGDRDLMDRCLDEADEARAGLRITYRTWVGLMQRAFATTLDGDLAGGEALANEAFVLGSEAGIRLATTVYGGQLLALRQQQGSLEELVALIEENEQRSAAVPAWSAVLAQTYAELGRAEDVARMIELPARSGFEGWPLDITWLMVMGSWADCATLLRHEEAAHPLLAHLLPFRDQIIYPGSHTTGAVGRFIGNLLDVLGDPDGAEAALRRALAIVERFGAVYWTARTQLDLAGLLQRHSRDEAEAGSLVADASAAIERFGFDGLRTYGPLTA
ncbi:MAG: AAA family ATPase [Acidimicrobiales bacterium]